jgi:hypothetical protein
VSYAVRLRSEVVRRRPILRGLAPLACFSAFQLVCELARAHAPPVATDIQWIASEAGQRAVIRTNRGLIFEGNEPGSFSIACNDAFQVALSDVPPVVSLDDGRLLIGTFQAGLLISSHDHCGYAKVSGPIAGINTVDLARNADGKLYAAVQPVDGSAAQLFASSNGESFDSAAVFEGFPNAIALAARDAARVYVSASVPDGNDNAAILLVSNAGGAEFAERPIELHPGELRAFVRAVDPLDPDRVFIRTQSSDGVMPERLLLSEDAGLSFQGVLTAGGPIVVHATADSLWAGTAEGLYRSLDRGRTFERAGPEFITRVGCVSARDGALYVCGYSEAQRVFGVLESNDDGNTFDWFLRFPQVGSRVSCALDSDEGARCEAAFRDWSIEQGFIPADMPFPSGGAPSSPGDPPLQGSGGAGAGGSGSAGAQPALPSPSTDGGCALETTRPGSAAWAHCLFVLAVLSALARRRTASGQEGLRKTAAMSV